MKSKKSKNEEIAESGFIFMLVGTYGLFLAYYTKVLDNLPNALNFIFGNNKSINELFIEKINEMTGAETIYVNSSFILFCMLGVVFFVIGMLELQSGYKIKEIPALAKEVIKIKIEKEKRIYGNWKKEKRTTAEK